MSSQQPLPRRQNVLKSSLCAAWFFGALTLGRLVHDYVPSGGSSHQGAQSGKQRSSLRASKVEPSGVQGVHLFPSLHKDTTEAGIEPPDSFSGASAALAAAAMLTCAVTMWGVGLQRFAGSPAQLAPTQQQAISFGTSQASSEKKVPARFSPVQVGSKKLVAASSTSAPRISSQAKPSKSAQLNAAAIKLRDDARAILKHGRRIPANEVIQSAGSIAVGATAGRVFRSYAQKRVASSSSPQATGSYVQAGKSAFGTSREASTKSLSSSTTSLSSERSATSTAKKNFMTFVNDMSFASLPGTQESEEKALRQYLLDMRHVRSRG